MIHELFLVAAIAVGVASAEYDFPSSASSLSSHSSMDLSFSYDLWSFKPCAYMDQWYLHGQTWEPRRCSSCVCDDGTSKCFFKTCPICKGKTGKRPDGECCETCDGKKVEPTEKGFCYWRGKTYQDKQPFTLNPCTDCECQQGTGKCEVRSCPPLDCKPTDAIQYPDKCCPVCPDKIDVI